MTIDKNKRKKEFEDYYSYYEKAVEKVKNEFNNN